MNLALLLFQQVTEVQGWEMTVSLGLDTMDGFGRLRRIQWSQPGIMLPDIAG